MSAIDYPHAGTSGHTRDGASSDHEGHADSHRRGPDGAHLSLAILLTILSALLWVGPDRVGGFTNRMLQAYLDAQQTMLEATGNLTADGRAEFAVLLRDGSSAGELRAAMAAIDDVSFAREADLEGWVVITTTAGNRAGLDALQALPQSRLVVPNRGIWICH